MRTINHLWLTVAIILALAFSPVLTAGGQQLLVSLSADSLGSSYVGIDSIRYGHHGPDSMVFAMKASLMELSGRRLPRQHRVTVAPFLKDNAHHSIYTPPIDIYGSWAYYHDVRTPMAVAADSRQYRNKEVHAPVPYIYIFPREPWMDLATVGIVITHTDACGHIVRSEERTLRQPLTTYNHWKEADQRNEQVSHLTGSAYVAFPVNKTMVLSDFRRNATELQRLRHTIDSVNRDSTIEIRQIIIKGFASPEGNYANNDRLARERTAALTRYIIEHTSVAPGLFRTDYEAEDWQGLRTAVAASGRPDTTALLALIDSREEPDAKLARIQSEAPEAYRWMLADVFPRLRHTDYSIDYVSKHVTEIKGRAHTDTVVTMPLDTLPPALAPTLPRRFTHFRPWLAVKTNLLYDLCLAPNIELELPLGRRQRWSIMAEYANPWYRWSRLDHSYEIQEGGLELRRWFAPLCDGGRPWLCGHFAGLYAAALKYDLEHKGVGDQGELFSAGLTYGHSWPLCRRWNIEASVSLGIAFGERRHYNAEFESTHLIYKYTKNIFYAGPTKLKLSLVYLLGADLFKKGGAK